MLAAPSPKSHATADVAPPRVLFGSLGAPAGVMEVASWAKREGAALPAIVPLAQGRIAFADGAKEQYFDPHGRVQSGKRDELLRQAGNGGELFDTACCALHLQIRAGGDQVIGELGGRLYQVSCAAEDVSPETIAELARLFAARRGIEPERLIRGDLAGAFLVSAAALGARFMRALCEVDPAAVGFRVDTQMHERLDAQVSAVRLLSDAAIVLGGPTATAHPREVLAESGADYVLAGEAEATFAELCRATAAQPGSTACQQAQLLEIPGLAFRFGGQIHLNAPPVDGYSKEATPLLSEAQLRRARRDFTLLRDFSAGSQHLIIIDGRGCPGLCVFCQQQHGKRFRANTPREILAEVRAGHETLSGAGLLAPPRDNYRDVSDPAFSRRKARFLNLLEEDFFLDRARALEFLARWQEDPLSLHYRLNLQTNPVSLMRHGVVDEELMRHLDQLKAALQLGGESFNGELLARLRKRHNVPQLEAVIGRLERIGAQYIVNIILADYESSAEELLYSFAALVDAGRRHPNMRPSVVGLPLVEYDSELRRSLEFSGRLSSEQIGHFDDYHAAYPALCLDPLVPKLGKGALYLSFGGSHYLPNMTNQMMYGQAMLAVLQVLRDELGAASAAKGELHPQTLRLAELLQWFEGERAADAGRHLRPRFYD